jgi:hypothetical protein
MKNFKRNIAALLIMCLLSACTTRPSNIVATSVSPILYDGANCSRLRSELMSVDEKISMLTTNLERDANIDAALVVVGFLFVPLWLGTAATGGKSKENELANLKGQREAIMTASVGKNCSIDFGQVQRQVEENLNQLIENAKTKCESAGLNRQSEAFGKCVIDSMEKK